MSGLAQGPTARPRGPSCKSRAGQLWRVWACVLALGTAAAGSHRQLARLPGPRFAATSGHLPPGAARLLSCGNPALAADLYYLRAVSNFGDNAQHAAHYPALAGLLQQSVAIDPKFVAPYLLAGTSLLLGGNDNAAGVALLEAGCLQRPEVWNLPFYRGFYAYYVQQDFDEAARRFAAAARLPGAPAFVGPLATRMAAQSHAPEAGLELIDALLQTGCDDGVRAALLRRRPLLLLEQRLQTLQRAHTKFVDRHHRPARNLAELVAEDAANLAPCSLDPLGGTFYLTPSGEVTSHHADERLQPFRATAGNVAR